MTVFSELASIAAIGVAQRGALPPLPEPLIGVVPERDGAQRAVALLDAAAAIATVRRGSVGTAPGIPVSASPSETLPEPPPAFVSALTQISADGGPIANPSHRTQVLAEALHEMAHAGLRLPHRLLVTFLTHPDPAVRAAARPVLGERGRWLAELPGSPSADIHTAVIVADPWREGTLDEQVAYLARTRRDNAQRATELVEELWKETPASGRAAFAEVIAESARPDDEAFLENCLRDRARAVREAAWDGLARIPGSAHVARQSELARSCLTVSSPRRRLVVTPPLPEPEDKTKIRSAERVTRMVAAIPPGLWPELIGVTAAELLALPQQAPEYDLAPGLVEAAVRWRDAPLATALVLRNHLHSGLVALAPVDLLAAAITRDGRRTALPDDDGTSFLDRLPRPWPDPVADAVAELLAEPRPAKQRLPSQTWALFALSLPASSGATWADWMRGQQLGDGTGAVSLRRAVNSAATILTMRATLWRALRDPACGAAAPFEGAQI